MGERTKTGLGVLGAALALGVLGDWLLRAVPWGVNVPLWVGTLIVLAAALALWRRAPVRGGGRWMALSLVPAAVLFAALVAVRDTPFLAALNVLAALVTLSLAALWGLRGRAWRRGVAEYVFGGVYAGLFAGLGAAPVVLRDVAWRETGGGWRGPALGVARGTFIAAPLVLVFGALFVAADAVFERVVLETFDLDVPEILGHLLLAGFVAWVSAGFLRLALLQDEPPNLTLRRPDGFSLGIIELGTVLGLLNLLFLAFVALQARYLFGGADRLLAATGLTYAEYARRGFFELVAVAALLLPLLLAAHWLLRAEARGRRLFGVLAGSLVALLFVVVASALWRMRLYVGEFGLTQDRLYATAFVLWLSVVLVLLAALVLLRDRRDLFGSATLASGLAAVLLLNALNPDALVARTNLARMEAGQRFDAYYLTYLGADAVPVMIEYLPRLQSQDQRIVEEELRWRLEYHQQNDWRSWNLGRAQALNAIESRTENEASFNVP